MPHIAYLGPAGTYSHLVGGKRFRGKGKLVPLPSVSDICEYAVEKPGRLGIVPIENSSGGAIYETVDILLANRPAVHIREELCLNVRLALLGRSEEKIRVLYSHFAPLEHVDTWLKANLPDVEKRIVNSTAEAAIRAAVEPGAAALGSRHLARVSGLEVLVFPVEADVPNLTIFYIIGPKPVRGVKIDKTTLSVRLPNRPGALVTFLACFRDEGVNLSRLLSRPIRGCPGEYAFLVDVDNGRGDVHVRKALKTASATCLECRVAGSYPSRRPYHS